MQHKKIPGLRGLQGRGESRDSFCRDIERWPFIYRSTVHFRLSSNKSVHADGRRNLLVLAKMSDPSRPSRPSRPSPYSYPSHSSEARENDSLSNDWTISPFSQPSIGFPVGPEAFAGSSENPAPTTTGDRSMNAKVPIPRTASTSTWTSSGRVSRACENCREQKAKCSGHRPTCQRCQESGVHCSYGDRKREKMTKCVEQKIIYRVTCLQF